MADASPDMKTSSLPPPPPPTLIDEHTYCTTVLLLTGSKTEGDLDFQLQQELQALDLLPPQVSADIEGMTSSLSATTFSSDSHKQGSASLLSQSTAPTSCASSERRPPTQSSIRSGISGPGSSLHPVPAVPESQPKKMSGFRSGFRSKMAGLKRRKSPTPIDNVHASISVHSRDSDKNSIKSELKSPASFKSSKSSWSNPASAAKSSYDGVPPDQAEALNRSMQSPELKEIQRLQTEEKDRFIDFEGVLLADTRSRRDAAKDAKAREHQEILEEKQRKVSLVPAHADLLLTGSRSTRRWKSWRLAS
jgi:hypothetical protein